MNSNHSSHFKIIAIAALFVFVGIFPAQQAHALANGTLWGWGMNYFGNLGLGWADYGYDPVLGYSRDYVLSPTQVGTDTHWASISAGNYFVMGIKTDGTLWGWGNNYSGNLGLGDTVNRWSPTQVGTDTHWASVSAEDSSVMAVKTDGTLWAWGYNANGQLGLGDTINRSLPTQVGTDTNWSAGTGKISGGYANSAAIKTDGTLWVWGSDIFGETGQGSTNGAISLYYPTQVGRERNWDKVSTMGQFTVLATKTNGTLWAWGDNSYGQLGLGYADYSGNGQHSVPAQVGTETNWSSIGQGDTYSMALKTNGTMWVWGRISPSIATSCGSWICYGVTVSPTQIGTATDWRSLGVYPYPQSLTAIKTNGTLWDWGDNSYGNLGLGDTIARNSPTQVGTGTNWGSVTVGIWGTMATTALLACTATTISNCSLPTTASGSSVGGSCSSGYSGSCNYLCTNGVWSQNLNSCTHSACTATTISNCSLPATASGSSAGSCSSGYSGSCNYLCTGGIWSQSSNSCALSPTATLFAFPTTIDRGYSSVLTWNSANTTSCTPSGGFSTGGATSGSASTGILTSTQNYQVLCTGPGGSINSNTATITVLMPNVSLSATPTRVLSGTNAQITWNASQVESCIVLGPGLSSVSLSGSRSVPITSQSTFTVICQTNSLPITKSVTVNVPTTFGEF